MQKGCSFQPTENAPEVAARLAATQLGKNAYVKEFAEAASAILTCEGTFTVNDFYNVLRGKDVPSSETKRLFERWSKAMVAIGRIKQLPACYDDPVFQPVGV